MSQYDCNEELVKRKCPATCNACDIGMSFWFLITLGAHEIIIKPLQLAQPNIYER